MEDQIEFKIPMVPPSMNSLYNVLFSLRKVELKPEVRLFKSQAKQYVPHLIVNSSDKLQMEVEVNQDWYYKNGKLKKQDIQNMGKCLVDLVSEKLGFEDSQIWDVTLSKKQVDSESFTRVKLRKVSL